MNNITRDMKVYFLLPVGSNDKEWIKEINNSRANVVLHNHRSYVGVFLDTFNYVRKEKPDVIVTLNNLQIIPIVLAKKCLASTAKLYAWHHFPLNFLKGNRFLKYCDAYLSISSEIKKELINLGIDKQRIELIYNPVDRASVIPSSPRNTLKHLIYVGRLEIGKQKNVDELYHILKMLKNNNWILDVYGDGNDKYKLQKLAQKLKIQKKINYWGWKQDVWEKIEVADLMIMTSNYEGFSMSLAEAIAHGVPCVSSDCSGSSDIIMQRKNGYIYKKHDIKQAARIIDSFLENDSNLNSPLQIQRTANRFYTETYVKNLFNILKGS